MLCLLAESDHGMLVNPVPYNMGFRGLGLGPWCLIKYPVHIIVHHYGLLDLRGVVGDCYCGGEIDGVVNRSLGS